MGRLMPVSGVDCWRQRLNARLDGAITQPPLDRFLLLKNQTMHNRSVVRLCLLLGRGANAVAAHPKKSR